MITVALIGRGRWGANIDTTLRSLRGVEVLVATTAAETKKLHNAALDGVLIATPGSTHAEVAEPFIARGLPTYIEKPLTTSVKDAERLQRAAAASGAPVFVGHVHLYNPAYAAARAAVMRGNNHIRTITFEGMNNGPIRDDMSVLWDWGPHGISLILDLLGHTPTHVQAWGQLLLRPRTKLYDKVSLNMFFSSRVSATCTFSWLSPEKRVKLTIVGTKNSVVFDDTARQKVTLYQGIGPQVQGNTVTVATPHITYPRYAQTLSLTAEMRAFIEMIRHKSTPPTDIHNGVAVVAVLAAAERSIALAGKSVKV